MRQADVQSQFLRQFSDFYPRLAFKGLRLFPGQSHAPYDLALRVGLGEKGAEIDLLAIVLGDGFPKDVERMLARVRDASPPGDKPAYIPVLVAPYFGEESCELCRSQGVGCFDLAGNALLEAPNVFMWVSGRENPYLRERQANSPFRGKAERVARRLLLADDQRWSMRRLSQASGVSLGLTSTATSTLADMGFVNKTRQGMDLYDRTGLLDAWADAYDLRQSAFKVYRSMQSPEALARRLGRRLEQMEGQCGLTLWSGASALLDGSMAGNRLALYYEGHPEAVVQALGLSTQRGDTSVFVFQPYDASLLWDSSETGLGLASVHPLQLYLDLCSGDEDELALARQVRTRLVRW